MEKTIPIILVTGFLGAGKTTFINTLISKYPDKKISLILNEFGDVKLESQFVEKKGIGLVTELNNGCLCCVANVDLPRVINYTLDHAPQTEYLVIEASGLSDPDPVRATLQGKALANRIRLDTTIVIVDADNFNQLATTHPLVLSQIADADLAFISKTSGHSDADLSKLVSQISSIGTGTKTLLWHDSSDLSLVFDPPMHGDEIIRDTTSSHASHQAYESYLYTSDHPHDLDKLQSVITNLPSNILRVKGYVLVDGKHYLIQRVGNHVDTHLGTESAHLAFKTAILVIGTELDQQNYLSQYESCRL